MAYIRCGTVAQSSDKVKTGTFSSSTSGTTTINCGFKPKYVAIAGNYGTTLQMSTYNSDYSTSKIYRANSNTTSGYAQTAAIPNSTSAIINSITDTGFTVGRTANAVSYNYFAIG